MYKIQKINYLVHSYNYKIQDIVFNAKKKKKKEVYALKKIDNVNIFPLPIYSNIISRITSKEAVAWKYCPIPRQFGSKIRLLNHFPAISFSILSKQARMPKINTWIMLPHSSQTHHQSQQYISPSEPFVVSSV